LPITLALVLLLASAPGTALAGAQPVTLHFRDVTEVVLINNPCFGPATGTITYDAVVHVTENANGYHTSVHMRGTSLTIPFDPNIPAFTGRFNENQSLNLNRQNANQQFVVTQRSGGMQFHITFHLTLTPGGEELSVFNFSCGD
jgi:hypothetical protein